MSNAAHEPFFATSIDPSTGQLIERFSGQSDAEVEDLLVTSVAAFERWREQPLAPRVSILQRLAQLLTERLEPLAHSITREMGKTLVEARAEVMKCAKECEWYAQQGPALLADEAAPVSERQAYVSYLPLGPILAVMPWNFPLWQAMRAAVPILLGGNVFILKPAPNVVRCALGLEQAWRDSGLPPGAFSVLNASNEQVGRVASDARVAGVTVTGSVRAGSALAAMAGRAVKKSLLELGGSDPFLVLADADLPRAVATAITARFQNAGQVCLAAKRFIVEQPVAAEFIERFVESARKLVVGNPLESGTDLGPMARSDLREELHQQVKRSIALGAKRLLGAGKLTGAGYFYAPTVLGSVVPGMPAFEEETFGPVASMIVAASEDEAIALANRSEYGLSSALWTQDLERARRIARRLETGGVFINGYSRSDPRIPVGGVKKSGYGRELSHFGLREFMNAQAVWIEAAR